MYKDYIVLNESKIVTSDEGGLNFKDNYDEAIVELSLENDIELIKKELASCTISHDLDDLKEEFIGKLAKIGLIIPMGYALGALIFLLVYLATFGVAHYVTSLPTIMGYGSFLIGSITTIIGVSSLATFFAEYKANKKQLEDKTFKIDYLEKVLEEKKSKLAVIKKNRAGHLTPSGNIYSIDTVTYKEKLEKELKLLEDYRKYQDKYLSYYHAGTIDIELRSQGYTQDDINFTKSLIRQKNKKLQ